MKIGFDVCQLESNSPCEDRFHILQKNKIQAFAVLDGHGGFLTADTVGMEASFIIYIMSLLSSNMLNFIYSL
jgi:hypothetical protein